MFSSIMESLPTLWAALLLTLKLTGMAIAGGVFFGTLLALARLSPLKWLRWLGGLYVNYFRSIPILMVILWFYFITPLVVQWITGEMEPIGAFTSCLIAFVMSEAAYFSEIVRAGIQSINKGQVNAAKALGMTYRQTMWLIILPQAFRKVTPLLLQQSIILFQDTTLVYAVGLLDFLGSARSMGDISGELTQYLAFAGAVYFIFSFFASVMVKRLQKRLAV